MLRLAFDFIITWRETRTRPNAYVQTLQNLLVRIIYYGIVQRIQVNKRSPFAAVSHPRTDDGNRYVVVACGGSPAVAWRI